VQIQIFMRTVQWAGVGKSNLGIVKNKMKNKHGDTEARSLEREEKNSWFFLLFSVTLCLCGFSKFYSALISERKKQNENYKT